MCFILLLVSLGVLKGAFKKFIFLLLLIIIINLHLSFLYYCKWP